MNLKKFDKVFCIALCWIMMFVFLPVKAKAAAVNVALNKPVIASSFHFHSAQTPELGNDGATTYFVTDGLSNIAGENHFWMVDLLAAYKIDSITITYRNQPAFPEHKNFRIVASNTVDFSQAVELASKGAIDYPTNHELTFNPSQTEAFRYVKIEKTNAAEALGFREVTIMSADTPASLATPPAIAAAQIGGDILTVGKPAFVDCKFYSQRGAEKGTFYYRWVKRNVLTDDPYGGGSTPTRYVLIKGSELESFTPTADLAGNYVRAIVFSIDSEGTVGNYMLTPPRRVYAADFEAVDLRGQTDDITVTASSNQSAAVQITDGDLSAGWHSGPADTAAQVTIDLGSERNLSRIILFPREGGVLGETKNISIEASADAAFTLKKTLPTITLSYNGADMLGMNPYAYGLDIYSSDNSPLRYVRIKSTGAGAANVLGFSEVKLISYEAKNTPPVISGVTFEQDAIAGGTLRFRYAFSDADGHGEGVHAYQWFLASQIDGDYIALHNETAAEYAIDPASVGSFLKVRITPRDELGRRGAPFLSQPIEIFGNVKVSSFAFSAGELPPGGTINAACILHNTTSEPQKAVLILGIYDKTTGFVYESFIKGNSITLEPNQVDVTLTLPYPLTLPADVSNLRAVAIVWDSYQFMNAYKNQIIMN